MTYEETLNFLFSQLPMYQRQGKAAYKANLDNTHALDSYFSNPHRSFKTVHVAGTNGKGSTSHMIAAILQEAGYKVGLYTSPHLLDFRERIKVNGETIPEQAVVDFVADHEEIVRSVQPSFFEMTVALAFDHFRNQRVDVAVVEVGMGGRLDSTNIVTPELSVITNIGLDHTDFLGKDLASIAGEKAGIIKKEIPVIVGQTQEETTTVFNKKATEQNSPIIFADRKYSIPYGLNSTDGKQTFNVHEGEKLAFENLQLDLLGFYQKHNLITALCAIGTLQELGWKIEEKHIRTGLSQCSKITGLLGRWQIVGNNPLMVCDTGHNEDGLEQVLIQIRNTAFKQLHIVFGVVNDKNVDKILSMLPQDAHYYFTRASIPRSLPTETLAEKASTFNMDGELFNTVESAISSAQEKADENDLIFIGGSTFVVADALLFFNQK